MPHVETRGVRFHYQQMGKGPNALLLHGMTGNLAVWMLSGLMHKIRSQFCVTAFDMRGHGYTETPPDGYTSEDMAHDVAGIAEELQLDRLHLLGHSFGGVVALHTAALYPDLVAGVILSDPFIPALHHLQADPRKWRGFAAYKENAASAGIIIEGDLWDLQEMLKQAASLTGERREMFIDRAGEASLERLIRLHATTCGADVAKVAGLSEERIKQIETQVICMYGENSPFLPICHALAELLPNGSVDIIPGAEHFAFEENPPEYVDRVERHLCKMTGLTPTAPSQRLEEERRNVMTDSEHNSADGT